MPACIGRGCAGGGDTQHINERAVYVNSKLLLSNVYKTKWDNIQKQCRKKLQKCKNSKKDAQDVLQVLEGSEPKHRQTRRKTQLEIEKTRKIREQANVHIKNTELKLKRIATQIKELRKKKAQRIAEKLFSAEKITGKRTHKQLNAEILELLGPEVKPRKYIINNEQENKGSRGRHGKGKTHDKPTKKKNKTHEKVKKWERG